MVEKPTVFMVDPLLNKETGATNLVSAYSLLSMYSEKAYLWARRDVRESIYEPGASRSWANRLLRATKAIVVDSYISESTVLIQHEYFGHASVDRELVGVYNGVTRINSNFGFNSGLPFPFLTNFHGSGSYTLSRQFIRNATIDEWITMYTAGVESTQVMANRLAEEMAINGQVDNYCARLYLDSRTDLLWYITSMNRKDVPAGHDLYNYMDLLNYKYWYTLDNDYKFKKIDLQKHAWLIVVEPMTIISLYETYRYIMSGDHILVPTIGVAKFEFLPYWTVMLSPCGVERSFGMRGIANKEGYFNFYYRIGDDVFVRNCDDWGFGLEVKAINSVRFVQGLRLDFWKQPSQNKDIWNSPAKNTTAVLNGLNLSVELSPSSFTKNLHLRIGYKTDGYLPGQQLHEGAYGSVRMSF
jgi:hypothetical protein